MVRPIKILHLGKNGLTEAFILEAKKLFETERMIKIQMLRSACRDKKMAKEIAEKLVGELGEKFGYKLIGYTLTVSKYRKNVR